MKEHGTKISIPHPTTYQRGTFQGLQKNKSTLIKEVYVVNMSFDKMVLYLKDVHVMIWCDHAPLQKTYLFSYEKWQIGHGIYIP